MPYTEKIIFEKTGEQKDAAVTIVVSLYNYEKYIIEALDSIENQTLKGIDLVIVDDCSSDNSSARATEWLTTHFLRFRKSILVRNDINIKLPATRNTALRYVETEFVFILDADNILYPRCIESLLKGLQNSGASFSYSGIEMFGAHTDIYNIAAWDPMTLKYGNQIDAMVLIRKEILDRTGGYSLQYINGMEDYELWFRIAAIGGWGIRIPEILMRYRVHHDSMYFTETLPNEQTITDSLKKKYPLFFLNRGQKGALLTSWPDVREPICSLEQHTQYIAQLEDTIGRQGGQIMQIIRSKSWRVTELFRYTYKSITAVRIAMNGLWAMKKKIFCRDTDNKHGHSSSTKKSILIVPHEMKIGGAQLVAIRLANILSQKYRVFLYCARPQFDQKQFIDLVDSRVAILKSSGDARELRRHILENNIDLIHSHLWWSDKLVYEALRGLSARWIITLHGDYESFARYPNDSKTFTQNARKVLKRADKIVYVSEKNKEDLAALCCLPPDSKLKKIYNGYQLPSIPAKKIEVLGIKKDDFVFGIVSRPLREKGWEEAINATIQLSIHTGGAIHLIMVGGGEYADWLKEEYKDFPFIHFVGYSYEPSEWIQLFNVGLLPTFDDNLPNTIVEYLAHGIPTITTDTGEIRSMLQDNGHQAGIILPLDPKTGIDVATLRDAMAYLFHNPNSMQSLKKDTNILFQHFKITECVNRYIELIDSLLGDIKTADQNELP